MTTYVRTTRQTYAAALAAAWLTRPEIAASVTDYRHPATVPAFAECYVSTDGAAGYLIVNGDLRGLFAGTRGHGAWIVADAVRNGAATLDCFDGYLPTLYARHGFVETGREANWTPGGPDVVYMARGTAALCGEHGAPLTLASPTLTRCADGCEITGDEIRDHLDGRTLLTTTTGALVILDDDAA